MKKDVSVLIYTDKHPECMKPLVYSALRNASQQIQFLFWVDKKHYQNGHNPFVDNAHALYSKFPVELFDPCQEPTIKLLVAKTKAEWETILDLYFLADGRCKVQVPETTLFEKRGWDLLMIDEMKGAYIPKETFKTLMDEAEVPVRR